MSVTDAIVTAVARLHLMCASSISHREPRRALRLPVRVHQRESEGAAATRMSFEFAGEDDAPRRLAAQIAWLVAIDRSM